MVAAVALVVVLETGQRTVPVVFSGSSVGSLLGSPLVVPGAEPLVGDQLGAAATAMRANPVAVAARERSRTAYAHLTPGRVGRLLAGSFPAVIMQTAGGTPELPRGGRVVGYPSSHAIQVVLPGHRLGVVESTWPVAKGTPRSGYASIDLSLVASGASYVPARSDVAVVIPRQLSSGVSMPENGVTLTPVDSEGRPFSGHGMVDHSSVVYPNTQPATDTLAKPTPTGFQMDDVLRSASSPQQLFFKVGAPSGATLSQDSRSGVVAVQGDGRTLATVMPPGATDAAGTTLPVSMSVAGHTLVVNVAHNAGSYMYPIDVDPEVNDTQLAKTTGGKRSNWEFHTSNGTRFAGSAVYEGVGKEHLETKGISEYAATEWAYWGYETKGNSKIYELKAKTSAKNIGSKIESFLEFEAPGGAEKPKKLLSTEGSEPEYSEKSTTICAWNASKVEECLPAAGKEKNAVHFQQSVVAPAAGKYAFLDTMSEGIVSISEPSGTHSKTSFDTTTAELEFENEAKIIKRKNALYGSGIWLTKAAGALKMTAEDPGIGVAATKLEYESSPGTWTQLSKHEYLEKENSCQGVQCYASHSEYATFDPKLPDGQQKIRYRAEEAISGTVSLESEGGATIKVDTGAPHRLTLNGLPYGNELSERPYELTAEATDGEGSTIASSGIKSIALYVDGSQFGTAGGSCTLSAGECTATDKWTVNGAELGSGKHAIVIVVFDNAGNEARKEITISIRHSTPVSIGPGSVDLESGDFTLGTTDVNMGSGLTVSRNYSSRALEAGDEGPLGPEWQLGMGATESVVEMPDHGVLLTDAKGKQSIFAPLGGGEFESPTGDSNLKLWLEENKTTKEKLAYYLEDVASHTKTKFTLPSGGTKMWVPTRQEGTVASDTVTTTYQAVPQTNDYPVSGSEPQNLTAGPDGRVWFTDYTNNKIGRMTTSGSAVEFSLPAESDPYDITVGPDKNLWFTDFLTNKVSKITTSGAITEYALASGSGPEGITVGPDNNLWFTDWSSNKIGKITPSGTVTQYPLPAGGKGPADIVSGSDGNLWFVESQSAKVGKITTSGVVTEYTVASSSYSIAAGPDGNLWFTMLSTTNRIGSISTSGVLKEYSLVTGSSPSGITAGSDKNLWYANLLSHKISKITTAGVVTEYAEPSGHVAVRLGVGPDGNLWYTEKGNLGTITTSDAATEPTEILAPVPAGVSCTPMKEGCRSLKFTYATATTATGENQSSWGEYTGRLTKVLLNAYDPVGKKMQETAVTEYSYDNRGELRAVWDPRITPALKTTYGYDEEGHVTALNQPGQEPWTFTYGTSAADAGTGRLLKVGQASVEAGLWGGTGVKSTEAPTLSGSPAVGVRMAVSNGGWSGGPVTYGYQWNSCTAIKEGCKAILGASNANYTPTAGDVGHVLVATVTATNGGGSIEASSSASATVAAGYKQAMVDSGSSLNAVSCVPSTTECVVSDSKGKALYATNVSSSTAATWTSWSGPGPSPSQAVSCPTTSLCMLAAGGNLYHAASFGGSWTLSYSPSFGVDAISCPSSSFCADGQNGSGYFRYSTNPGSTSWTLEQQGTAAMKGISCLSSSFCAIADGSGSVHAATTTTQVESSAWTSTNVDGTTALNGVACTSTTSCVAVDAAGNALSLAIAGGGGATATTHHIDGTNSLTAVACPTSSKCVAVDNKGNIFVSGNAGATWTFQYQLSDNLTSVSCPSSSLCVTVDTTGNVVGFNPREGTITEGEAKTPQVGFTLEYGVSLSGGSGLPVMSEAEVGKWGQTDVPVEGTAVIPPDSRQAWPASSYARAAVYYLDEKGRTVNVSKPSGATYGAIATTEYNEFNDIVRTLSPDNRQAALESGSKSVEVSKLHDTVNTYNGEGAHESEVEEPGTRLIDTLGPQHQVKYVEGSAQKESLARLHMKYFYDEGAPSGEKYNLVTKTTTLAQLANEEEREVHTTTTSYSGQSNLGWKLRAPTSMTKDPEGKKITTTTLYNSTTGQVTETRGAMGATGESSRDGKFIYYTAAANTEGYPSCGSHPEWAGLTCETLPAKQPEAGTPRLAITTVTAYNVFNEPETITETFGSTTRTKKETYDAAGRLSTGETTSTEGVALPKVTNEYNSKTGLLEKQSTTVEAKTKTVTSKYNAAGELTEYTDADGNTAKYVYGGPENDGLLEEMTDGSGEGSGKQIYAYNATTKTLEKLLDSSAGTFTAAYDAEGKLTSEVYPNGMCAKTAYNTAGEAINIEYIKTTNCSETGAPVWYSESRVPSVRGETYSRTSTLAGEQYFYDSVGRLTEGRETPSGQGCSVRLYAYDDESNRTSQTARVPGVGGVCATEGGTVLAHTYDEANHLKDSGVTYDAFGNATKLPAADAEGHELSSTFYVDNAVATQAQNGVTNNYYLDPIGRIRETVTGGKATITHYDASGETAAWTSEGSGKGTRSIAGIGGGLVATQTNSETPVLQMHDLQGDAVATAALSSEATKVLSTYNSTEFGVPNAEKAPPKFAWLGAADIGSSLASGVITYGSTSYVPQVGRGLQSEQVEPPGLPGGSGAGALYTAQEEPWNMQGAARAGAEAPGLEAARERAALEAAVEGVDPIIFMNRTKARAQAEAFFNLKFFTEVVALFDIPGDIVEAAGSAFGDRLGLDEAFQWLHDAGEKLMKCAENKRWRGPYKVNICRFQYEEWEIRGTKITFPDFGSEPDVEECVKPPGDIVECPWTVYIFKYELA
jgi:streptogramin lyase